MIRKSQKCKEIEKQYLLGLFLANFKFYSLSEPVFRN